MHPPTAACDTLSTELQHKDKLTLKTRSDASRMPFPVVGAAVVAAQHWRAARRAVGDLDASTGDLST